MNLLCSVDISRPNVQEPGLLRPPTAAIMVLALSLLALTGCGGPAYEYDSIVTGTVTVDGDLAKLGTVVFHPAKGGKPAIGRIHPDGSYSLRTGQGDLKEVDGGTIASGEYLVTVSVTAPPAEGDVMGEGGPAIPGPSMISQRYAAKETTDLRFTVKPGKQVIVLNLDAAEPVPPPEEVPAEPTGEEAGGEPNRALSDSPAENATTNDASTPDIPTDNSGTDGDATPTNTSADPSATDGTETNANPAENAQ